jgi:hypothetical protein
MRERIIYAALFVLILLATIHALLHVFEIEHPNIPEWLFPGGLTLTATRVYRFTRPATDRSIRLRAQTGRGGGRLDICASAEIGAERAFGVIAVTHVPLAALTGHPLGLGLTTPVSGRFRPSRDGAVLARPFQLQALSHAVA